MTDIMVPATPVTGLQAKIVRDNVANPDTELGARALAPFKQQTLSRAQQAYRTAYAADPDDATLTNSVNDGTNRKIVLTPASAYAGAVTISAQVQVLA